MPQWNPFLLVTGVVTVAILFLARQSQQFISDELATDTSAETLSKSEQLEYGPDRDGHHPEASVDPFESERQATPECHSRGGAESTVPVQDDSADVDGETTREPGERPSTRADGTSTGSSRVERPGDSNHRVTDPELTTGLLLANVTVTQALVALVLLVAIWYFSIPAWALGVSAMLSPALLLTIGLGVSFGLVLWVGNELSTTLADAVGASYDESVRELLAPESTGGWLALFGVVLPLIAFAEELLFRAALIGVPAAAYGVSPWLLAVVSSGAFALGHGAQGRVGIAVTGALGFVLAGGYIVSGSLLLVVVAHYVINAMEFLVHEYLGYDELFPR